MVILYGQEKKSLRSQKRLACLKRKFTSGGGIRLARESRNSKARRKLKKMIIVLVLQ